MYWSVPPPVLTMTELALPPAPSSLNRPAKVVSMGEPSPLRMSTVRMTFPPMRKLFGATGLPEASCEVELIVVSVVTEMSAARAAAARPAASRRKERLSRIGKCAGGLRFSGDQKRRR